MVKTLRNVMRWEKTKSNLAEEPSEPENKKKFRLISRIIIAVLTTIMVALAIFGTLTPVLDTGNGIIKGKPVNMFEWFLNKDITESSANYLALQDTFGILLEIFIFGVIYLLGAISLLVKMFVDLKKDRQCAFTTDIMIIVSINLFLIYMSWFCGMLFDKIDVEANFMLNFPQYFSKPHPNAKFYFVPGDCLVYGTLVLTLIIFSIGVVNLLTREKGFFSKYKNFNFNTFLSYIAAVVICIIIWIIILNINLEEIGILLESILRKAAFLEHFGNKDNSTEILVNAGIMCAGLLLIVTGTVSIAIVTFRDILFYGTANDATLNQAIEYKSSTSLPIMLLLVIAAIASTVCSFILKEKYGVKLSYNYLLIGATACSFASLASWILFDKIEIIK